MNALRLYDSRGSEAVVLEEVPMPAPGTGEVLIRVHATAVTPGEVEWYPTWHTRGGAPRSHPIPSHEFSGVVEAIGAEVTGLKKGDPVYGMNDWFSDGAAAEYCVASPAGFAPKPATIDHLHAAAVPISGLTAWQALFERGKLAAGQKVLIHGGAGGVGSIAIQLAAWKGAFVATTVSEANAESSGDPKVTEAFFIVEPSREQLVELAKLVDAGVVRPILSEVLPLEKGAQAYFPLKKSSRGKAVLQVSTP